MHKDGESPLRLGFKNGFAEDHRRVKGRAVHTF